MFRQSSIWKVQRGARRHVLKVNGAKLWPVIGMALGRCPSLKAGPHS